MKEKLQHYFLVLVALLAPFIVVAAWQQGPEAPIVRENSDMEYRDLGFHKFAYNLVESARSGDRVVLNDQPVTDTFIDPNTGEVIETTRYRYFAENETEIGSRTVPSANSYRIDNRSNRLVSRDSAAYDGHRGELVRERNQVYSPNSRFANNYSYATTASVFNTGVGVRGLWVIFIIVMLVVIYMLARINYRKRARVIHHYSK
jgi:hypothetical protein